MLRENEKKTLWKIDECEKLIVQKVNKEYEILHILVKDVNIIEHCINGTFGFPGSGKNGILLYGDVGTGKSALAKLLPDLIEQGRTGKPSTCARFINVQLGNNSSELIVKINNQCELIPFDSFHYFVLDQNLTVYHILV
jgi:predicted ATPase